MWGSVVGRTGWLTAAFALLLAAGCASKSATFTPTPPSAAQPDASSPSQAKSSSAAQSKPADTAQPEPPGAAQPKSSSAGQSEPAGTAQPEPAGAAPPKSSAAPRSGPTNSGRQAAPRANQPTSPQSAQPPAETPGSGAEVPDHDRASAGTAGAPQTQGKTAARPSGSMEGPGGAPPGGAASRVGTGQERAPSAPPGGLTEEERAAALEARLQQSLEGFDRRLQREQAELQSLDEQQAQARQDRSAAGRPGGSRGEAGGRARNEPGGGAPSPAAPASGSSQIPERPSTRLGGRGNRTDLPVTREDIPDAQDDDVVARQLREAAEKETDPKLREKLWEEYRKYKARSR